MKDKTKNHTRPVGPGKPDMSVPKTMPGKTNYGQRREQPMQKPSPKTRGGAE
jgi:hypothetical protein